MQVKAVLCKAVPHSAWPCGAVSGKLALCMAALHFAVLCMAMLCGLMHDFPLHLVVRGYQGLPEA